MNYLARREHSHSELLKKLRQKQFSEPDIQQVLNKLQQQGLQSDARFAENYTHYRRNRGYGPIRIRAELLERGLTEEFIEDHLKITDNAWFNAAYQLWQKRFKGVTPTDFKTRAQQMRFLYYRGFTKEQIESVYNVSMELL